MAQRNINLTDHLAAYIAAKVESGEYQNASEVVREALRRMQQRDEERAIWLAELREIAAERFAAFDRGEGVRMDSVDEFMDGVQALRKSRR
ncbi:MAG: type II toxin-antitoxin system ParD family antitoxin [Myxococcales bacterium]|nr:type II toxin-antitoxin system ParD family antitoxin [Myxococcales bacterium]